MPIVFHTIASAIPFRLTVPVTLSQCHDRLYHKCSRTAGSGVEKNSLVLKKTTHLFIFGYLQKNVFFRFFKKKEVVVIFLRTDKPHSVLVLLHHAISPFSELHNNSLLYLLWHSKLRVKNVPHLCFRKVLLVNSLQSGKAWQACAQQTEKSDSHTTSAISHQVYVHAW